MSEDEAFIRDVAKRHRQINKPWMAHPRCAECGPDVYWPCDAARLAAPKGSPDHGPWCVDGRRYRQVTGEPKP